MCAYGTDCTDCGARAPSAAAPPSPPPPTPPLAASCGPTSAPTLRATAAPRWRGTGMQHRRLRGAGGWHSSYADCEPSFGSGAIYQCCPTTSPPPPTAPTLPNVCLRPNPADATRPLCYSSHGGSTDYEHVATCSNTGCGGCCGTGVCAQTTASGWVLAPPCGLEHGFRPSPPPAPPPPPPWCACGHWCSPSPVCNGEACVGTGQCGVGAIPILKARTAPAGSGCTCAPSLPPPRPPPPPPFVSSGYFPPTAVELYYRMFSPRWHVQRKGRVAAAASMSACRNTLDGLGMSYGSEGEYADGGSAGCTYHPGQSGWAQRSKRRCGPDVRSSRRRSRPSPRLRV